MPFVLKIFLIIAHCYGTVNAPSHSIGGQVNLVRNVFCWLQSKFSKPPLFATRKFWSSLDSMEQSESRPCQGTRFSKLGVVLLRFKMDFLTWPILSTAFLHSKSTESTMLGKLLITKTHLNGPITSSIFLLI